MTSFIELIIFFGIVYIFYRGFQIINYLNFKIHVLEKILRWKLQDDEKIWENAIDYVIENDYEYKNTLRMVRIFSKPNSFETVDHIKLDLKGALKRYHNKYKE